MIIVMINTSKSSARNLPLSYINKRKFIIVLILLTKLFEQKPLGRFKFYVQTGYVSYVG